MTRTSSRLAWPDVAKGVSILGVVVLHITSAVPDAENTALAAFNRIIDPLRMPLFFLVSGFFSSKVLSFKFRELFTRRLWFFIVPYLVWETVAVSLRHLSGQIARDIPPHTLPELLRHLVVGNNFAWFLVALVLFNIALWGCRRFPPWLALALSFTPFLLLPFQSEYHMIGRSIMYLPVFFMGVYLRPLVQRHGDRALQAFPLVISGASYALGIFLSTRWAQLTQDANIVLPWILPGAHEITGGELDIVIRALSQFLMLPAAITGAVLLSKVQYVSQGLQFIGRHTLPIYLGHTIGIALAFLIPQAYLKISISLQPDLWYESTHLWMLVGLAASGLAGLALWAISKVPVLGWTMKPPQLPETVLRSKNAQEREPQPMTIDVAATCRQDTEER